MRRSGRPAPRKEPNDNSELFGAFTGEEAGGPDFLVEQGQTQELRLRERIAGGLLAVMRALAMSVKIHYLWLLSRQLLLCPSGLDEHRRTAKPFSGGITTRGGRASS